jgi:hypothetical protein
MRDKTAALPLGHDGYLKLWTLSHPRSQVDYITMDEAQHLNPVTCLPLTPGSSPLHLRHRSLKSVALLREFMP